MNCPQFRDGQVTLVRAPHRNLDIFSNGCVVGLSFRPSLPRCLPYPIFVLLRSTLVLAFAMSAAPITVYTNTRAGPLADNIRQTLAALRGYSSQAEIEGQAKILASRLVSFSNLEACEPRTDLRTACPA